jgi:hypothetical protein
MLPTLQIRRVSANDASSLPSFSKEGAGCSSPIIHLTHLTRGLALSCSLLVLSFAALAAGGCGVDVPSSNSATPAEAKPAAPAIPDEIQKAADTLLGSETQVLAFGDLAKNGGEQLLAANVLPKTPTMSIPGTVISRATVAEKNSVGQWIELLHCDEHLKNSKGYLALTPLDSVSSWRLQFEQDAQKGLQLYVTPVKSGAVAHVLPIGIRWNPATKRYQSLDQKYEHFLLEAPSLEDPRSVLR